MRLVKREHLDVGGCIVVAMTQKKMQQTTTSKLLSAFTCVVVLAMTTACTTHRLAYNNLHSPAMEAVMGYAVYAPTDLKPDESLPLVVFLHGGGDSPMTFERRGLDKRLDAAMKRGDIPRVVIVVPDGGRGFWENWVDGSANYRDWVTEDLMPHVAARYHTAPCPKDCHVMGVSMGGHGTLRFALERPDLFASATALSAPVFDAKAAEAFTKNALMKLVMPMERIWPDPSDHVAMAARDVFARWRSAQDLKGVRLVVAWAERDRGEIVTGNQIFAAHLAKYKVPHRAFEFKGKHAWVSWNPVIERLLAEQLGHRKPTTP